MRHLPERQLLLGFDLLIIVLFDLLVIVFV